MKDDRSLLIGRRPALVILSAAKDLGIEWECLVGCETGVPLVGQMLHFVQHDRCGGVRCNEWVLGAIPEYEE